MPKLKKVRSGKFTLIQNLIFEDHRLSYKEIGIYCNMMKFPDDWEFSIRYLAERHKDKRDSVRTGIEKLIEYGYIARSETQHRDERGFYGKYDYIIYEDPLDNPYFIPCPQISEGLTSADLDRCTDFPTTDEKPCTDFPTTDFPYSDDPLTDNPTTINTIYTNTVSTNTVNTNIEEEDVDTCARVILDGEHGFMAKLMNVYIDTTIRYPNNLKHRKEMKDCFNAICNAMGDITDPVAIKAINTCSTEEAGQFYKKVFFDMFSSACGQVIRDDIADKHAYLVKYITNKFKETYGPDPWTDVYGFVW